MSTGVSTKLYDDESVNKYCIINEIGDLRFLSGAISQKRTEIVDFTDFYETFWSECRKRMQRPK